MNRIPVISSNIRSIGDDASSAVLEVEFKHGAVYQYIQVPAIVYGELIAVGAAGGSVGRYFDQHVKKAGYAYTEL